MPPPSPTEVSGGTEHLDASTVDIDGLLLHAELEVGGTTLMFGERKPNWPFLPQLTQIYVEDLESVLAQAVERGARIVTRPTDFFGTAFSRMLDMWWVYQHGEAPDLNWESDEGHSSAASAECPTPTSRTSTGPFSRRCRHWAPSPRASESPDNFPYAGGVNEVSAPASRMRIRWGWIIGCIVLGLAGIAAGFFVVGAVERTAYVASVLAGVGTTLLLVGFVVLLERQIVDTAAKAVRRAVDAERAATDARIDRLVGDLKDRLSAEWDRTDAADVEAMKRRTAELTDETTQQIVEEANRFAERGQRDPE